MNLDQSTKLPELLRLATVALGDGVVCFPFGLEHPHWVEISSGGSGVRPHADSGDSRWLECQLGMSVRRTDGVVRAFIDNICDGEANSVDYGENMETATLWAVLRCAAKLGKIKEMYNV